MIKILADGFLYFNLIIIPIYCCLRIIKNSFLALLNPCFYLLIFGYFYLTVSSAFLESANDIGFDIISMLKVSQETVTITNIICNWFTFVFFIFYIQSKDINKAIISSSFTPKDLTTKISMIIAILTGSLLVILILRYAPSLQEIPGRKEALEEFTKQVIEPYRLGNVITLMLASVAVLSWRNKNFIWYPLLILPIILESSSRGRTLSSQCILFAYLNYVAITRKPRLWIATPLILGFLFFAVTLRVTSEAESQLLIASLMGEFVQTRLSTIVVYDNFLNADDLLMYFFKSFFKILPGALSNFLLGETENYVLFLERNYYDDALGFSVAGNIVSEALFYGGLTFAIVSPIIIGSLFLIIHKSPLNKTFPGFIFCCFLIIGLIPISRGGFYEYFVMYIYLMFSYLLWITILEYKKV